MSNGPMPAPPAGQEGVQSVPEDEISLWEVLAVLLRRRGTIVFCTGLMAVLAVAFALLRTPSFTTSASFTPQGSGASQGQLLALASQFGVNVGSASDGLTPVFYAELLTSRGILLPVATAPYTLRDAEILLADLLEIEEDTEDLRSQEVVEWLSESAVNVETGLETGIVSIEVKTEWPEISLAIAERLVEEVSRFNLETRQSQDRKSVV